MKCGLMVVVVGVVILVVGFFGCLSNKLIIGSGEIMIVVGMMVSFGVVFGLKVVIDGKD